MYKGNFPVQQSVPAFNFYPVKANSRSWAQVDKMPEKPVPAQWKSPLQGQYCHSKDWYDSGWRRQPQTNHSSRKDQGRDIWKKQWKREDGLNICISLGFSSAQQAVHEGTEVQSSDWAHSIARVYAAFEHQGTQLTSLHSLEAPCSAAIPAFRWETHAFLTMITNFSRYLTQQGNKIKVKKKKSVFSPITYLWTTGISLSPFCASASNSDWNKSHV